MKRLLSIVLLLSMTLCGCAQTKFIINPFWTAAAYPLDLLTTNGWAAYSVSRKLKASYAGSCLRVKRSSDDTNQDIGFVGNAMDVVSLTNFVGSGSGYINILYDQSGNARHLDEFNCSPTTTNCAPQIIVNGTLQTDEDGRPVMLLADTGDGINSTEGIGSLPGTYFLIFQDVTHVNARTLVCMAAYLQLGLNQRTGDTVDIENSTALLYDLGTYSGQTLASAYFESGTNDSIQLDNLTKKTGTAGNSSGSVAQVGDPSSATTANYKFSEWIIYDEALSASDTALLQNNINGYYTLW